MQLLTTKHAAKFIGISEQALRNARSTGEILGVNPPPHLKLGRSVRYKESDLVDWLDSLSQFKVGA